MKNRDSRLPSPEEIESIDELIDDLATRNEKLPEAVRTETDGKVHELEVMRSALHRDLREASRETGADFETASQLFVELKRKATEFDHEMEALAQGAPTTVDTTVDAGIRAVEKVAKRAAAILDRRS